MENKNLGIVEINPRALEVIVSIAAQEVEGVSKLLGSLKNEAFEKFGRKEYSKGVRLVFDGEELIIDINCSLKAGFPIAKVASQIQENVRNSIYNMTELNTKNINVNISGIDY